MARGRRFASLGRDETGCYAHWWAMAIYGNGLLHEGWFPAAQVTPAPYAEPDESI